MKCPYLGKCSDEDIKCATCMRNEKRSYYVPEYPGPTSIEWPYLPCDDLRFQSGDDLRFPTSTIAEDGLEVWDETVTLKEVSPYRP